MVLEIHLPHELFIEKSGVSHIVAETGNGSFGILPHRLDCVAALCPGILMFDTASEGEVFVAVDEGMLIKTGPLVRVSTRRALAGTELAELRDAVEQEFLDLDEHERSVRAVLAKIENDLLRRLSTFRDA